jgi:hypothetical protein
MKECKSQVCFLFLLLFLATGKQAWAYADPGSGALIWQTLVAAFVGFAFYFRRIVSWVRSKMQGPAE